MHITTFCDMIISQPFIKSHIATLIFLFNKMIISLRFRFYLFCLLLSSYWNLVCGGLIAVFGLLLTYYDVLLFVILLQRFIYVEAI